MPWTRPTNEETLLEVDLRDAIDKISRYRALVRDPTNNDMEPGVAADLLSTLVFTMADFTSSLAQGIRPKSSSKAWPELLEVSRQLLQVLERDPPTPEGVDPNQSRRLKTTLNNFLIRVQKMEPGPSDAKPLQEEEVSRSEEPLDEEEEEIEEELELEEIEEGEEEEEEVEELELEEMDEMEEVEDLPPKLVPIVESEGQEVETKEEVAKPQGRPAEPEMGTGDMLVLGAIITAVVAYALYSWFW